MKALGKKADATLLALSLMGVGIGAALIFFSGSLLYWLEAFLETKVFHREFDLSKWQDTINALLAFPVFIVTFLDAVLFLRFSDRTKIILLVVYAAIILFFTAFCSCTRSMELIDSDMASEILLAEECFLEKSFWPRTWNYSTEIRLLNTQLIAAPVFAFTSSWVAVKAVSATLLSLLLPLSLWFLLGQLEVRRAWTKVLWCLLMLCPWSSEMWRIVQFGNYYIPHIAIAFIVIGLFFALVYRDLSLKKYKFFLGLFIFFSFTSGLAGIRYILYFLFPLAATIISIAVADLYKMGGVFSFRGFFVEDKKCFFSCLALALGGIGYVANNVVLSSLFSFSQFNTTSFTSIGAVSFSEVQNALLGILGYKNQVSVFTPSGIVNILLYVGVIFFILAVVQTLKGSFNSRQSVFLLFSVIMFGFNAFIFINTEYIARYFILPLAFIVPCAAVLMEDERISVVRRYMAAVSLSVALLSGAFVTYGTVLCSDHNASKYPVRDFLVSRGYEFGYGTFWNANVFTFLTDGRVRLGNLDKHLDEEGVTVITKEYGWDNWLTPDRYYTYDYGDKPIFLVLTQDEYGVAREDAVVQAGAEVYCDEFYRVFEYPSHEAFKAAFSPATALP